MKKSFLTHLMAVIICLLSSFTVYSQDYVDFYANMTSDCEPFNVQLTNSSYFNDYLGTVNYEWRIDGYPFSVSDTTVDTTLARGNYYFELIAYDTGYVELGRDSMEIESVGMPTGFNVFPGTVVCPGEEVRVDYHFNDAFLYSDNWDFGNGDFQQGNWLKTTYQDTGMYTIALDLNTVCGADTFYQQVTVTNTAVPNFNAIMHHGTSICPNDEARFSIDGDYTDVTWTFSDLEINTGIETTRTFSITGNYHVIVSAKNACGNIGLDTIYFSVEESIQAYAGFNFDFDGDPCPNTPVKFHAESSGNYQWDFGDGNHSTEAFPVHTYADSGTYYVGLIVNNSCGSSDTSWQEVVVDWKGFETLPEMVSFSFQDDYLEEEYDTLEICPGESVAFWNETWGDHLQFTWDFGDNDSTTEKDPVHTFQNEGVYYVTLTATDNCGREGFYSRYIWANPNKKTGTMLDYAPKAICPGEKVYFFDNNLDDDELTNTYSVWFGDGTSETSITTVTDNELYTIASHVYDTIRDYNFVFTATNSCGNTDTLMGTITVSDVATRKPFYHVENSTGQDNIHKGPMDWSTRISTDDHVFTIPVTWTSWDTTMNNTFFVLLWYDKLDPNGDPGPADGMVEFTSNSIVTRDSIRVYVPMDPMQPPSVGMAVGWYCDPMKMEGTEPDVWAMPDSMGIQVQSFDLQPGGFTHVGQYTGSDVYLPAWDGTCNPEAIDGEWQATNNGQNVLLSLWEDMENYYYDIYTSDDINDPYKNSISGGAYQQSSDTLILMATYGPCMDTAIYTYDVGDNLSLTLVNDTCNDRSVLLTPNPFMSKDHEDKSGCPGDPVKFKIAGGISYEWHFGDGGTAIDQFPTHAYADTGMYEAYVIATNACGRTDTIFTPVDIGDSNVPNPYFFTDITNPMAFDSVSFTYESDVDPGIISSYQFSWEFGDGATSTEMNPMHVYTSGGNYHVKLTVTNGCGSATEWIDFYVEDNPDIECYLAPAFTYELDGKTVTFADASTGTDITNYAWSFGDQQVSFVASPTHTYSIDDQYEVCLTLTDSINNCTNTTCEQVVVGTVNCVADFTFTQDTVTNTLYLHDASNPSKNWYWEIDGKNPLTEKDPVVVFDAPGYYNICLTIINDSMNCSDSKCEVIQVGVFDSTACHVDFNYQVDSLKVQFSTEIQGNIDGGQWSFGDGMFAYEPNPIHEYAEPGIYDVCAMVYDSASGCHSEVCKTINVGNVECYADFNYLIIPETKKLEVYNTSPENMNNLQWNFGDGTVVNGADTSHVYQVAGVYEVCLFSSSDAMGCQEQRCKEIIIASSSDIVCDPKVSYVIDTVSGTIKFNESSGQSFTQWYWSFGDNSFATGKNPEHVYSEDGVYEVCVLAKDDSTGCINEKCKTVTVNLSGSSQPALSANYTYLLNLAESKAKFFNESTGEYTKLYWTFGDGNITEDVDTVTHAFRYPRTYNICLNLFDANTGKISKKCKEIFIGQKDCDVDAGFVHFIDTSGYKLNLQDKSLGTVNSWFWNFGDETTASKQNPTHNYSEPGFYFVSLSVQDTVSKCSDHATKIIQVGQVDCYADFEYTLDPATNTVSFMNKSTGTAENYFWLFNGTEYSTEENPSFIFENNGMQEVVLTVSDHAGLCNSSHAETIQVGTVDCSAKFNVYVDSATNEAYFTSEVLGDVTKMNWKFGDGGVSENENPVHYYSAPGYYTVGLFTRNMDANCIDYTEKVVLVGQKGIDCEANFTHQVGELATTGTTMRFYDNSSGEGLTYLWDFGDGTQSTDENPTHVYTEGKFYNVCLSVTNTAGIVNTTCKLVKVPAENGQECLAKYVYTIDSANLSVSYADKSVGNPTEWSWDFGNENSSALQNPIEDYDSAGYYLVKLKIKDAGNCETSHYKLINVSQGSAGLIAGFGYEIDSSDLKASGYPVDFIGVSTDDAPRVTWEFGDGSEQVTTTSTPTHVYDSAGTYTVCFTVEDPVIEDSDTYCQQIQVGEDEIISVPVNFVDDNYQLQCMPNPFLNSLRVIYNIPETSRVQVMVYNSLGETIKTLVNEQVSGGIYQINWENTNLESGVYIVRMTTSTGIARGQVVIKK